MFAIVRVSTEHLLASLDRWPYHFRFLHFGLLKGFPFHPLLGMPEKGPSGHWRDPGSCWMPYTFMGVSFWSEVVCLVKSFSNKADLSVSMDSCFAPPAPDMEVGDHQGCHTVVFVSQGISIFMCLFCLTEILVQCVFSSTVLTYPLSFSSPLASVYFACKHQASALLFLCLILCCTMFSLRYFRDVAFVADIQKCLVQANEHSACTRRHMQFVCFLYQATCADVSFKKNLFFLKTILITIIIHSRNTYYLEHYRIWPYIIQVEIHYT